MAGNKGKSDAITTKRRGIFKYIVVALTIVFTYLWSFTTVLDNDKSTAKLKGNQLYLVESFSDLPIPEDEGAFAVTSDGIYRYNQSATAWQSIKLGSRRNPIPKATLGSQPTGRPLISNGEKTVYVDPVSGRDSATGSQNDPLATIQEAVNRAPIYLRHQYTVDLANLADTPVTYDEDVLVPTIIGTGKAGHENGAPQPGPVKNLVIRGKDNDASAIKIGSIMFGNVIGTSAGNLFNVSILRNSPYDDEKVGLSAYGTGEVHVFNVRITDGPTNGVLAYGSKMKASRIDFGKKNVELGLWGKRHASIVARKLRGETKGNALVAGQNSFIGIEEDNELTGNNTYNTRTGGIIHDSESDTWFGPSGSERSDFGQRQSSSSPSRARSLSDHPSDVDPGDIWYIDGAGEPPEGFYGQTSDGPVKIG